MDDATLLRILQKQRDLEDRLARLEARGGLNPSSSPIFSGVRISHPTGASSLNIFGQTSGEAANIEVGAGGAGNRYAYVDLVGDDTYTDYAARLIRNNGGANSTTELITRGTGGLFLHVLEAGAIEFWTNGSQRGYFASGGGMRIIAGLGVNYAIPAAGNIALAGDITGTKYVVATSYVPTWTGTGSNPAIGNGTLTGYYVRLGDMVLCWIQVLTGGTTTYGTGTWEFAIPVAAATPPRFYIGSCQVLNSGVADYIGQARLDQTTSKIRGIMSSGNSLGPTVPHTWVSGDVCALSVAYRV